MIAKKALLTATERKLRESLLQTKECGGSDPVGNRGGRRNRDIQTRPDSFERAKGETCGARKPPHSLHGDMQWWQTRLGARANLVARAEHDSNVVPREMIVYYRIRLIVDRVQKSFHNGSFFVSSWRYVILTVPSWNCFALFAVELRGFEYNKTICAEQIWLLLRF